MKKKIYLLSYISLLLFGIGKVSAQKSNIGIGTTNPNESAVLEIESANKGLLIPRMTEIQRDNINNPANSLLIYQTTGVSGFYFFDADQKKWSPLNSKEALSVAADPNDWTTSGNAITTSSPGNSLGTTNFIGTTNSAGIVFKTTASGLLTGFISPTNTNLSLGYKASGNLASGTTFTGVFNTALGTEALAANTSGSKNVALGMKSLFVNTTGSDNVAIGTQSLTANVGGNGNLAVGYQSMRSNISGNNNLAFGLWALRDNTSGGTNVAVGYGAMAKNTSGTNNVAIGANSLQANLIGTDNTAIGLNAGYSSTGVGSVFIGRSAGYNETGSDKLYIANSSTATPLIYGDFSAKFVSIGDVDPAKRASANTSGGYNLLVKGGILTEKVKVALASTADWADYVFEPSYNLMSLEQVESFTKLNKHLPNVPSADEMAENGLDVNQTSKMFMEKIEELTLYLIELNKEVKELKAENLELRTSLK